MLLVCKLFKEMDKKSISELFDLKFSISSKLLTNIQLYKNNWLVQNQEKSKLIIDSLFFNNFYYKKIDGSSKKLM